MPTVSRRAFMEVAAALGATGLWSLGRARASTSGWQERRERFPEGVASGDPHPDSVLLWTRCPQPAGTVGASLQVEVAEDAAFTRVIATSRARILPEADWTCRVLAGGLAPARRYWYRFTDRDGNGSRIGRTITAPGADDPRPVSFAFVSCQNANQGAQNAYRRMIYEDERAAEAAQLAFVLHLGDFIYEIVWYPPDRPQGMYDRRLRDIVRYPDGEKIRDFHIPTNLAGYRAVYTAYLHDPDLQDARARWPFVNMWNNHEFSWLGWQSLQKFEGKTRPAQTRKVAANQAFFEFQPARTARPRHPHLDDRALERFDPPKVADAPVTRFDAHGLGQEPNNLAAIGSLTGYRALRFGRYLELMVTDQRSYRSEEPTGMEEAKALASEDFPELIPQHAAEIMDAGRTYDGGRAPATIASTDQKVEIANVWRERTPQTILGADQKSWFLGRLKSSQATWKIWSNTIATLDMRADPQNLPPGVGKVWPWPGYATMLGGDFGTAYVERGEIYDFVRGHGVTGFAIVAGDRHSFWAGLAAKTLPPQAFDPVGVAFVTGSISAPGIVEALEHVLPQDHALRSLFLARGPQDDKPRPTINMLLRHGVRSCLEYARSGDVAAARKVSNVALAPHVSFVDMGGYGYSVVTASAATLETEFVCIPRPLERSDREDGGPLVYRVRHRTPLWRPGEPPRMTTEVLEGIVPLSI